MYEAGVCPIISAAGIVHRYGGVLALDGVSLDVPRGAFAAILGPNGAGKSTLGLILSGMLRPTSGNLKIDGAMVKGAQAAISKGIRLVPEGRRLFGQMSVIENLRLGGYGTKCSAAELKRRTGEILEFLPKKLREHSHCVAASLSGGEQQMLAIGRALMAAPRVLIIDEPSLGLAPILIGRVYELLAELRRKGVTIVLIEQIATHALQHADMITVLDRGHIIYSGTPRSASAEAALHAGYVGDLAHAPGRNL
jgi:branched-chain amino acid transport system ATP-binding protein